MLAGFKNKKIQDLKRNLFQELIIFLFQELIITYYIFTIHKLCKNKTTLFKIICVSLDLFFNNTNYKENTTFMNLNLRSINLFSIIIVICVCVFSDSKLLQTNNKILLVESGYGAAMQFA